jgi:hypothetical protein
MALTIKNRFSIVGVRLVLFIGIKATIETKAYGLITDFWLHTLDIIIICCVLY